MAKKLGHEYKLFVGQSDGPPETFVQIAGQTGLTRDGSTTLINQGSKTSGQIDPQAPGRKTLTLTCPGKLEVPDPTGLEVVYAQQKVFPQLATTYQIQVSPFGALDIVFECEMFISNFSIDDPDQDNSTFSFQLTCADQPTIDLLEPA